MAKAPANPAPMTLDRNDGSATLELYRAVLGPVHTDKYLRTFTAFDATGHSGISWNWSAALLTLNWMVFRRLWLPALAYAGVVAGALLLLFGIARLLFQVPDTSLWALAGLGFVLSVVVPGAYGNAWLYAACNKAMTTALVASANLEEACAALRKRSHGRQWLMGLGVGNAVLAVAVGAVAWPWLGAVLPVDKVEPVAATAAAAEVPAASSRSSQGLVQPAAVPVQTPAVASVASAVAPVAVASQALAPASAPAMVAAHVASAASSAAAVVASTPAAAKALVAEAPAKPSKAELQAQALQAKKEKLEKAREAKEAKAAKLALEAKAAKEAKEAKTKPVAKAAASTASASASVATSATSNQYLINVGLFADPNNARNAYTKLQDAGIPASIKELKSSKGPQTRVRAGPFDTEAEADRAAETIRGLRLDAVVIKP